MAVIKKKNILLYVVLLILSVFSLVYYFSKQRESYTQWVQAETQNIRSLQTDSIFLCDAIPLVNYFKERDYILIIFFEPTQCGSCLNEQNLWKNIAENNIVPVVGITSLQDSLEFRAYLEQADYNFLTILDPTACIQKKLNIPDTPCKILIRKDGRILLVDYVRKTERSKNDYMKNLKRYINEN